jgi:hypothetical protein
VSANENRTEIATKAQEWYALNQAFLDKPNPDITDADVRQHLKRLTRQANGLMRFLFGDLDDVTDT